jgi:asparagine synthase (glutamine-hydrolysing)
MYYNLKQSLPDDMLTKVDRMSMAYSLEARVPFLDYRIIEFLYKVDRRIKMNGYERKSILRDTIGERLPQNLLKARKKGFGVPLREWFKSDMFNDKFDVLCKSDNIFDSNVLKNIININKEGKQDLGNFIWILFVLNRWYN